MLSAQHVLLFLVSGGSSSRSRSSAWRASPYTRLFQATGEAGLAVLTFLLLGLLALKADALQPEALWWGVAGRARGIWKSGSPSDLVVTPPGTNRLGRDA